MSKHHITRPLAIGLAAITAFAPAGALAHPAHDVARPAKPRARVARCVHPANTTPPSITFTNPLRRARGEGTGGGLL